MYASMMLYMACYLCQFSSLHYFLPFVHLEGLWEGQGMKYVL